jgi:outer membrane lipoprotein-sorting protein
MKKMDLHRRRIRYGILCILAFLLIACFRVFGQEHFSPEEWTMRAEQTLSSVNSYTAIFHKQERIGEALNEEETIYLKFMKPFKVYMKWIKEPSYGREAIYVDGGNNNLVKVRECGLTGLINLNLDPAGSLIMKGSRHPMTDAGIENLVQFIEREIRRGMKNKELDVIDRGEEFVYGRKTRKMEFIFPSSVTKGYYCYRSVLNIDIETDLPVKVSLFDWSDRLIEKYGYESLQLNANLTDADFDPDNPQYAFRK